jgi:hypothetical protein
VHGNCCTHAIIFCRIQRPPPNGLLTDHGPDKPASSALACASSSAILCDARQQQYIETDPAITSAAPGNNQFQQPGGRIAQLLA